MQAGTGHKEPCVAERVSSRRSADTIEALLESICPISLKTLNMESKHEKEIYGETISIAALARKVSLQISVCLLVLSRNSTSDRQSVVTLLTLLIQSLDYRDRHEYTLPKR